MPQFNESIVGTQRFFLICFPHATTFILPQKDIFRAPNPQNIN